MSLPKEPRQLMINLMYLVLTALLALNVSNEVLNAFTIVDKSIVRSNANIDLKNQATIASFEDAANNDKLNPEKKAKVEVAKALAVQARDLTKAMQVELENYRSTIVTRSGDINPETGKIDRESDLDVPTRIMIKEGKGKEMMQKLEKYKKDMAALVDGLPEGMKLSAGDGGFADKLPINFDRTDESKSWEDNMFNMVPSIAAVTIIDKFKNDVKNSESAVLDELWASAMGEIKTKALVFKKYGVIASADNSYVLPGQKINITAALGAYNDGADGLRISIGGQNRTPKDGLASYQLTASGSGEKSVTVNAEYFDKNDNRWVTVPKQTIKYYVGQPQATISLDAMKILYKGLDNPLTVSASGVPLNDLVVTAGPNLTLVPAGPGKFLARVSANNGETTITIRGKRSDGSIEDFGTQKYRLGRVPDPVPLVAGETGGAVPVNRMKAQQGVFAKLIGFPYDIKYTVVSYTLFHVPKRGEASAPVEVSGQFLNHPQGSAAARAIMDNLQVGDRLYFENIKAAGPDGTRKLPALSYTFPN